MFYEKLFRIYFIQFLDETEDFKSEKTEAEKATLKKSIKKKNELPNEHFIFKKPETPSKSTSPVTYDP